MVEKIMFLELLKRTISKQTSDMDFIGQSGLMIEL